MSSTPHTIRMHERDNVAIVANDGGLPAGSVLPSGLVLRERVPQGHKVALVDIAADAPVLRNVTFNVEAGDRIAIIGPNGIGKTTLMHCIAGVLKPTAGSINWVENAEPGYMPQDPQAEFEEKTDLFKWMQQWSGKADDEQIVRATLGRLLFSGDETKKSVKVLSGGEKGRMMYGKLMLTRPNVLLLDEPTNHMDMETIESLQIGLEKYPGTLLFVSHDREFVSGLATRIIEIQPGGGIVDVHGDYDEYLKSQGLSV